MSARVMEVMVRRDGADESVWAVCKDGFRVITCSGRLSAPLAQQIHMATNDTAEMSLEAMKAANARRGFESIGQLRIEDGVIDWSSAGEGKPVTSNLELPAAYAELPADVTSGQLAAFASGFDRYEAREEAGTVIVTGPKSFRMKVKKNGPAWLSEAMPWEGAEAFMFLLALAERFGGSVFDADAQARTRKWVPELIKQHDPRFDSKEEIQELAAQLGLCAPPLKVKSGTIADILCL